MTKESTKKTTAKDPKTKKPEQILAKGNNASSKNRNK